MLPPINSLSLSNEFLFANEGSQSLSHSQQDIQDQSLASLPSPLDTFPPIPLLLIDPKTVLNSSPDIPEPYSATSGNSVSSPEGSSHCVRSNRKQRRSARVQLTASQVLDRKKKNQQSRDEKKVLVTNLTQENGALKAEVEALKKQLIEVRQNNQLWFQDYDGKVQETLRTLLAERQKNLAFIEKVKSVLKIK